MSAENLGAMPRLYGAPAYTPPRRHVDDHRPFDPDELPLVAHRSSFDQALFGDVSMIPVEGQSDEIEEPSSLRRAVMPFGLRANRPAGTSR